MRNSWTVFRPETWKANYIYIYTLNGQDPTSLSAWEAEGCQYNTDWALRSGSTVLFLFT